MSGQHFSEDDWRKLSSLLHARVAQWVFNSRIPSWIRQRDEIIEDLVQNALLRTLIRVQRAERGEADSIDSLEKFGTVAAYSCYIDMLRHDLRIIPLIEDSDDPSESANTPIVIDPSEKAINNIHYELIFRHVARCIVSFPPKQKTAILIDIANRMDFDPFNPTPLQKAFAFVSIRLEEHQKPLPIDKGERAKHAALLSQAKRRLRECICIEYDELFA
jgi:DNA-directed RNA polymerase specialized sigma24 family protein